MAKVIEHPTKYLPEDWHKANHLNYGKSEEERKISEMIRDESARLANETNITTMKTQENVNKKLEQRLKDIDFWKSELNRQYEETAYDIDQLIKYKGRLEAALNASEQPLHIAKECLQNRERRMSIDLVHDEVEIQLLKEIEVIEGVQALLKRTIDSATEQIRLLRSANYYLNKDITDKFSALNIDSDCTKLENTSSGLYFAPQSVKVSSNSVTPEEWETFSNKNVLKAERERNSAVTLRSMIDELLEEIFTDQQNQCNNVNLAFEKRIEETEKARKKFEEHLDKINGEINDMEDNVNALQRAIEEKKAPMQVSQTRLDARLQRPNVELCRDRVQFKLIDEVGEINYSVERLTEMLNTSEESLKSLLRQKLRLEENIEIKENTLLIDRDQNMNIRKQIVHKKY